MKWIELVIIRAVDTRQRPTVKRLVDHLTSTDRTDRPKTVTLYRNAFVETDIYVRLEREMKHQGPSRSNLGLELASVLEAFCRVHHTLWIPDTEAENGEWRIGERSLP